METPVTFPSDEPTPAGVLHVPNMHRPSEPLPGVPGNARDGLGRRTRDIIKGWLDWFFPVQAVAA